MKKTLTVNLGGTVFCIDEDAYRLLDNYLCNLKLHFNKEEGADEIVDDIERRISELFSEKMTDGVQVITVAHVEEVIARMGKPEEMEDEHMDEKNDASDAGTAEQTATGKESKKGPRRFYRNPDDKMIAGVAGGLAAYFNWDVTILRFFLIVFLLFGFQLLLPVYIICWLIVPEAKTAAERLSMRGEEVTVENIGKTVTDGFDKMANGVHEYVKSDKPRSIFASVGSALVSAVGWILKIGLVMVAIFCSPLVFALAVVLLGLVGAAFAILFDGGASLFSLFPMADVTFAAAPMTAIAMYISLTLFLGIPLLSLVYSIFCPLFKWQPMVMGLKLTLLLMWFISALVFIFCFVMYRGEFPELLIYQHI